MKLDLIDLNYELEELKQLHKQNKQYIIKEILAKLEAEEEQIKKVEVCFTELERKLGKLLKKINSKERENASK